MSKSIDFLPVILAGGSGTRFWPRSRRARAKQVLALDGERSMIQQTVERLKPLSGPNHTWVITNEFLAQEIADQLKGVPSSQIIQEPVARNTAPACGLAAFLVERENPDAVLGVFPSDHVIADEPRFLKALQKGIQLAAAGDNMVVLGIEPTRPETGYGYIETGDFAKDDSALHVRRFTEKPNLNRAQEFVAAGNYYWNSGMFIWSARTLANAVREHLPETAPLLEKIAAAYGTPQFDQVFRELYPKCENISVDYAILEPRSAKGEHLSNLYCLPAEFSWNDLGSWASLYEYQMETRLRGDGDGNVAETEGHTALEAANNYVYSPKKFVALVGVEDLVIVDTEDALLIARRDHSQDVGKIVKELGLSGRTDLI
ncbi:mannose-1-phosphate guanylyltransferase [Occallatibacter riparius]|uniref:mannose-1-phosphate guanylyltransferase n=1 Tax=Occallatibacter riparius TaxID=1002689 RepID=A0A9J7BXH0_9BACT|nr:mannose-1-phosphate guanylyltransferase [Occallatibacter riparius]UWZ85686.1 NTP transferase domain-containing protein [Occallatibacter riparius]